MSTVTQDVKDAEKKITETNDADNPLVLDLQRFVADLTIVFFNLKQYHWRTSGPHFRDHHLLFEQFAQEAQLALDEIAERIRMIGQDPLPSLMDALEMTELTPTAAPDVPKTIAKEAGANAILLIRSLREGVKVAEKTDDPGTVDMLSKIVRTFEKQEWYFRELAKR